jgi:hypothetical protein
LFDGRDSASPDWTLAMQRGLHHQKLTEVFHREQARELAVAQHGRRAAIVLMAFIFIALL